MVDLCPAATLKHYKSSSSLLFVCIKTGHAQSGMQWRNNQWQMCNAKQSSINGREEKERNGEQTPITVP